MLIPSEILARAAGAAGIILLGLLAYRLLNAALLARANRQGGSMMDPALRGAGEGLPVILYFTTPECAACKTVQRPALQRLQQRAGERLRVIEVDASQRPDLASRWGVLSVPTTFILDGEAHPRHVNHGATRAEKLLQQVEEVLEEHL